MDAQLKNSPESTVTKKIRFKKVVGFMLDSVIADSKNQQKVAGFKISSHFWIRNFSLGNTCAVDQRLFPYIEQAFPCIEHLFPFLEHLFLCVELAFPIIEHIFLCIELAFPPNEHLFPSVEQAFPIIEHIFPPIEQVFQPNEHLFLSVEHAFPPIGVMN